MKLTQSAQTDVGRVREVNQDSFGIADPSPDGSQLFVVCDGMGGHLAGEVASKAAVQTLLDTFQFDPDDIPAALNESFQAANNAVYERGSGKMGTTGVAAVLYKNVACIANVGDSRAYLIRKGEMRQLTLDHSYVEEQVRAGLLTPEQARQSNVKNIITRALGYGYQGDIAVDMFYEPLQKGDILMLSSDGLHGYVEEQVILAEIEKPPFATLAERLIKLANDAGGIDNITALLIRIDELDALAPDDDSLLQTLLAQNPPPASAAKTLKLTSTTLPLAPPTAELHEPVASAPPPPATEDRAPVQRGLSCWGAIGALLVLVGVLAVLYFYRLPPVNFLFPAQTASPAASPLPQTLLPTVTAPATTPSPTTTLIPTTPVSTTPTLIPAPTP